MINDLFPYIVGGTTLTIAVLTYFGTTNDRRINREREGRLEAEKSRDAWKLRAEAAESRADDYADRYFKLRDQRDVRDTRQNERDLRQNEREERNNK